jgi:hypothetical protein
MLIGVERRTKPFRKPKVEPLITRDVPRSRLPLAPRSSSWVSSPVGRRGLVFGARGRLRHGGCWPPLWSAFSSCPRRLRNRSRSKTTLKWLARVRLTNSKIGFGRLKRAGWLASLAWLTSPGVGDSRGTRRCAARRALLPPTLKRQYRLVCLQR